MKTFVNGTEEQELQTCTRSIFDPLQGCKGTESRLITVKNQKEAKVLAADLPRVMVCSVSAEQLARAFHRYRISITDRMHRSVVRPLLLSFSAWPHVHPCISFPFTPTSRGGQTHTHPLHGEQLDLVGSAFEESEHVLEDGDGALQVTCGSLTHCPTHRADYQLIKERAT